MSYRFGCCKAVVLTVRGSASYNVTNSNNIGRIHGCSWGVSCIGQKTRSSSEVSFKFPRRFTATETYWFLGRWKWVLRGASIHYGLMAGAVFPRDAEDLGPRVPMEGVPLLGADVDRDRVSWGESSVVTVVKIFGHWGGWRWGRGRGSILGDQRLL